MVVKKRSAWKINLLKWICFCSWYSWSKIGIHFQFTLQYNHYWGGISYIYAGLVEAKSYSIKTQNDVLGIGIYPVNLTFFKNLKLSIGAEFNYLVYTRQNGSESNFVMGGYEKNSTNNNDTISVNNTLYVGGKYEFKIWI